MDRDGTATRRQFLRIAVAGTVAGLAGCSSDDPPATTGAGGGPSRTSPSASPTTRARTQTETTATARTETTQTTETETETETTTAGGLPEMADATFRGGLENRGFHPGKSVPDDVAIEWSIPGVNKGDHTAAKASAVLAPDGNLIWPGDTGTVYSITPDGEVNWAAATDPSTYGIHGTPTVAGGTVYIGAYDGALYAFDLATGRRVWRAKLGDAIGSSPKYHDGTVYVAVEYIPPDGSVFGVNARTGDVEFESGRPSDHPHSTIAIDRDAGKLVVGSNDGNLYAWDYPSLRDAWRFETGNDIKGPIATYDGGAFFGSWDHDVYRVDLETGREQWSYTTDHLVMSGPAVDTERGVVYVGSHDDHLHAVDATSGDRAWTFDAEGWIIGCPVVTEGKVLFGSYAERLWALDRTSGEKVWDVVVNGRVTPEPLVVGDRTFISARATDEATGRAYAIGPV